MFKRFLPLMLAAQLFCLPFSPARAQAGSAQDGHGEVCIRLQKKSDKTPNFLIRSGNSEEARHLRIVGARNGLWCIPANAKYVGISGESGPAFSSITFFERGVFKEKADYSVNFDEGFHLFHGGEEVRSVMP